MPDTDLTTGAMPASTTPPAATAGSTATGAATASTGTPSTGAPATTGEGDLGDAGKKALDAERKAKRDAEKRATDAEAALKLLQDAQLSETDKLRNRLAELEKTNADRERILQERAIRLATVTEAARLAFADPDDAYRLLDLAALEFEEDGTPKNVRSQLEALLKAKPYLASAAARPSGSIDGGARGSRSSLTIEEIKRMTPDETEKRWDEIQAFLSRGRGATA